jgi:arsenite methyltransferase
VATSLNLDGLLADGGIKACCAALYESPAVRWFLGDELHPGGAAATRRSLELIELRPGQRLLDVGSGTGSSALLAAREFGCLVSGLDYGTEAVRRARQATDAAGLCDRVGFLVGDAGALPFADDEFDAVLCECSLSTFPDKARAVGEMRRVLRPSGRVAISDVVADPARLPEPLSGTIAMLACVGGAFPLAGYERLLGERGLRTFAVESLDDQAARLAERLEDRLRAGRLLERCRGSDWCPFGFDEAIEAVRVARRAIDEGALGYAILAATAR